MEERVEKEKDLFSSSFLYKMPTENNNKTEVNNNLKPNMIHPAFQGTHTFYRPYSIKPAQQPVFNPSTINPMFFGYHSQPLYQQNSKL